MQRAGTSGCPHKAAALPYHCGNLFTLLFSLQTLIHSNYPLTGTGARAVKSD